ncbi:VOC family protein [Viridibacillus sp. YIM B01967]|uniref:VOC family protein n=1 Tax=Viridibacillus soli TaxID=2798301 RepID=A0ABS1H9Z1_9BACL|nr:VOC family protein [Viridibacillus soli]MBK3495843.1 VOC family protein [Viridibacillus soli]
MAFVFDHLVQFVEEPKDVVEPLKQQGIHAVEGGVHEGRGTYNALSYFDLSYIEYLGTYDRTLVAKTKHLPHSLIETVVNDNFNEGFVRFAVRTKDIKGVAKKLKEQGLSVRGPVPLYRKRPDGSIISWQLLYAGEENDSLQLPFIIQWDDNDDERRQEQVEKGVIGNQSEKIDFAGVTFAVNDAEQTARKWSQYLGLELAEAYVDKELNANVQVVSLNGGDLYFASPRGKGVVAQVLEERGERPFQVNFSGAKETHTFELLNGRYHFEK